MPITFSREDHWVHISDPGSYPLVMSLKRMDFTEVLIDGGSGLNIIFTETLKRLDFNFERLLPCADPFYSIVSGKGSYPIGRVILPVTFSIPDNNRTEHLTFKVANFKTSYHAIFGRPMLVRFMAIPNHTYIVLKMSAPNGVLSIFGNVETSYKCDTEAIQLAETLEYLANATMMLVESKKVDQSHLPLDSDCNHSSSSQASPHGSSRIVYLSCYFNSCFMLILFSPSITQPSKYTCGNFHDINVAST
ncbi:hypothetical protein SEVIR_8G190001v4 [Setaria viridis]